MPTQMQDLERFQDRYMLYSADGAIAKIQFLDIFNLLFLAIFEESCNLKDFIVKGIQK